MIFRSVEHPQPLTISAGAVWLPGTSTSQAFRPQFSKALKYSMYLSLIDLWVKSMLKCLAELEPRRLHGGNNETDYKEEAVKYTN